MDWTSRFEPVADTSPADEGQPVMAATRLVRVAPQAQDAANQPPAIDHLDGDAVIQVESDFSTPYIDVGLDAVVSDPDGTDFSGGTLTVAVTSGFASTDELSITFFPPLSFNPADHLIFYNNVEFASYSGGGVGDATLTINFETGTTADMVQTVLRNIFLRDTATVLTDRTRTVEVTLNDGHGTDNNGFDSVTYTTTVSTLAINHAPQGVDATLQLFEDGVHVFSRDDFGLIDSDGNGLAAVEIDEQPQHGTLLLDGAPVPMFQLVTVAMLDAGALTFAPAPNAHGAGYDSMTFRVQDDGGTDHNGRNMDPMPHTITFDVAPVNDAPHGGDTRLSVDEDDFLYIGLSNFGFGDPDGNALTNVIIDSVSGAGQLLLSGVPVTPGQVIAASDIVGAQLVFFPDHDANGADYASFTFRVQDNGGTDDNGVDTSATANTIIIDVAPVNDEPSGTDGDVSLAVGGAYALTTADFGFSDSDGNNLLAVTVTTLPGSGSLLLDNVPVTAGQSVSATDIDAGKLTFAGDSISGTPSLTFQVQDDGGTHGLGVDLDQSPNTLVFHVGNHAPTFEASDRAVELISTDDCGCLGDGDSKAAAFSPDGSKILFESLSGFLGDTNPGTDIFVIDGLTGELTLVSTNAAGDPANGDSVNASFSADGTKVVFASSADNLVDGDTNGVTDIFLKDLITGEVTRLSTTSDGSQTNGYSSAPILSADGTKLVFVSQANNLVAGATNGNLQVYVKDLITGEVTCVSAASDGTPGTGMSPQAVLSTDGTKVAFASYADNLMAGDTNADFDIFVRDLTTGVVTRVSTDAGGAEANGGSAEVVFSPDGTKVAFASNASNLVAGDTNLYQDIFVKDLVTGVVTLASTAANGAQGDSNSYQPVFSPDGTKLAFTSGADNLVPGDANGQLDVFIKDLVTGEITRVSTDDHGIQASGGSSYGLAFSPDGSALLISSYADNLVPGDTNNVSDVFIVAVTPPELVYEEEFFTPVQVAASVILDDDGTNYDGGSLTIAITSGEHDGDVLIPLDPRVEVDGSDVLFDGVVIGVLTPDSFDTPTHFTIEFNAAADDEVVRAIAESVFFASASYDPTDDDRVVTFTLVDGGGTAGGGTDTTSFTRTIHVVPFDDTPFADDDTASVAENATQVIDVAANDTDPDGGAAVPIALIDGQAASVGVPITLSSGATVTLNADGTITYDPNHAFDYLISSATALATGAISDTATDTFYYAYDLCGCGAAAVTVTINGVDGAGSRASGDSGDNTIIGTPQVDMFFLQQGGTDHVTGDASNDGFYFGDAFDPTDTVDGGDGTMDQIGLQGDYSGGLTLGPDSMTNVEMLVFLAGADTRFGDPGTNLYSYDITTDDANVGAGKTLTVQGNALGAGENLTFDGSAETDGSFAMYGGLGTDTLTGGQKDDSFYFGKDGRFGPDDSVDGQSGSDQLRLQGDYSGGNAIVLGVDQVKSIDLILLASAQDTRFGAAAGLSYSYDLTTDDSTVASGETMTIQAKRLMAGESLHFDGSNETDGSFKIYAGAGDDVIIGGAKADYVIADGGNDRITGGGGADNLFGSDGNDVFIYLAASDSTAAAQDHILDFAAGDTIDVAALGITDFIGNAAFGHHAGEIRASFVGSFWQIEGDVDGDGVADLSILVTAPSNYAWSASDFVFPSSQLRQSAPAAPHYSASPETHGLERDANLDIGHAGALPALVQLASDHVL